MPYSDPVKQKVAQHESYLRHKERYLAQQRGTRNLWRKKINEFKEVPCMDCKIVYPYYMMDFDHRDRSLKKANISKLSKYGSWKTIVEEIAKCDVVCSNCHRKRTYFQNKAIAFIIRQTNPTAEVASLNLVQ